MSENIQYIETDDKLTIVIFPLMKPIVKTGLAFIGILVIGLSIVFAGVILYSLIDMGIMALVFGVFSAFGFYLGTKYVGRAFNKEIIEITNDRITITDKYLWNKKAKILLLDEILDINYVGRNKFTPHPLTGTSADYTGFGVSEIEVQYIIEDGTMEIIGKQEKHRFGKNVPSWDADVMVTRMVRFTKGQMGKE
jgi:hypothetical protein